MRTRGETDIASDHYQMIVKMKVKLKKYCGTTETALQSFNTAHIRYADNVNGIVISINDRFQELIN